MLASTERSLEVERQRRSQLQRVNRFRGSGPALAGCRLGASSEFCSPRSSEQVVKRTGPNTTTAVLTQNVGQSMVSGLTDLQQLTGQVASDGGLNSASGHALFTDNQKLHNRSKLARRAGVGHRKSVMSDCATSLNTSSATKFVRDEAADFRSFLDSDTPEHHTDDTRMRSEIQKINGRRLASPIRRWSSLRELPGRTASTESPAAGNDRRCVSGRRTSRLDRRVYQCYFAGILHSSRRSERFVRLQQLYAVLENVVEMQTEMSVDQQATPSATDDRVCQSPHSSHTTDPFSRKHWRQRSLELRKLYAKLDAAQDEKEFFYDTGHLDDFQWKSWRDLGLSKKSTSLTKLKDLFEEAVVNGRSAFTTSTSQLQHVEHGLSYKKLLGMFRHLEKSARNEAEVWLRWQSSSQSSITGARKLDGTYIKMMESAARNAKALALHGYHMNEHRNRYDAYVQSRRICRPKSSHNIFEQLSSDDLLETDEVASSERTASTVSFCDSSRCCNEPSDGLMAKSASDLTDSSHFRSPATSVGSALNCSISTEDAETCAEQSCQPTVEIATVVKEPLPEVVNCVEELATAIDNQGVNIDGAAVELGSKSKPKSRKRERQRPRRRPGNGTVVQRTDPISAVPGTAGRHHIDAWRRSSRPLSGTLNQALAYFNSLCIDNTSDKNEHSTPHENNSDSAMCQNEHRPGFGQLSDAEISDRRTPAFPASTGNEELPVAQIADRKTKFSTEIRLDINNGESVADGRRIMLPQLYYCRGEVRGAGFLTSNVASLPLPMHSRAVNIDKRRSQFKVDAMEPDSQGRRYASADAKKTEAETVGVRPVTSQSDVTTTPAVRPTYVNSAPVARMLSESQPLKTTSVSSPLLVDWREAVVRKLPTLINLNCQLPADHLSTSGDLITSSASNRAFRTDVILTDDLIDSDYSCRDGETKQTAKKDQSEASEVAAATAVATARCNRLPEDSSRVKNNVTYVTAVDSSRFICKSCCRSLEACNCVSTAERGNRCVIDDRLDNVGYGLRRRSNDSGKSVSPTATDDLTLAAMRPARGLHQQPVTGSVDTSYRELRPISGDRRGLGRQDVEMRRMMDSLETIGSEWTSGRPTRLTSQPVYLASDMNNNNGQARQWKSEKDEHGLPLGHLNPRETDKLTVSYALAEIRIVECLILAL